jgi:hypothetical protein
MDYDDISMIVSAIGEVVEKFEVARQDQRELLETITDLGKEGRGQLFGLELILRELTDEIRDLKRLLENAPWNRHSGPDDMLSEYPI